MKQKSVPVKEPATQVVKKVRRATRRHFSAEDKIRIVLEGLRGRRALPIARYTAASTRGVAYLTLTRRALYQAAVPAESRFVGRTHMVPFSEMKSLLRTLMAFDKLAKA
jgi:hypothetical protein